MKLKRNSILLFLLISGLAWNITYAQNQGPWNLQQCIDYALNQNIQV